VGQGKRQAAGRDEDAGDRPGGQHDRPARGRDPVAGVGNRPAQPQPDGDRNGAQAERHPRKLAAQLNAAHALADQPDGNRMTQLMHDRSHRKCGHEQHGETDHGASGQVGGDAQAQQPAAAIEHGHERQEWQSRT
jgi:hypothetical protein